MEVIIAKKWRSFFRTHNRYRFLMAQEHFPTPRKYSAHPGCHREREKKWNQPTEGKKNDGGGRKSPSYKFIFLDYYISGITTPRRKSRRVRRMEIYF